MASTQASPSFVMIRATSLPTIRAYNPSSDLRSPSHNAAHAVRARLQQPRRLAACRSRLLTPTNSEAETSGAGSHPRAFTNVSASWATTAGLSPLLFSLLQPLEAAAALDSLSRDVSSNSVASAAPIAASEFLAAVVVANPAGGRLLYEVADMDAKTAGTIAFILRPVLSITTLLMIVRIVLTWYPQLDGKRLPWSIAVAPTEPVLGPTRRAIPPVGGVDVAPIVWVAFLSFINEILLGPQGILNLLQRKAEF